MTDQELSNTYIVQDRSEKDLERLLIQDEMLTQAMGGLFPEQPESAILQLRQILDVGSGTGGWLREVAHLYPNIEKLVGVDISNRTILYAKRQAEEQKVADRIYFYVMDALRILEFPENSFDLINLRLGVSFMRTWDWPKLLHEFRRVARPGAIVRILDSEMGSQECSSTALTTLLSLLQRAFFQAGHFFSEGTGGFTSYLPELLTKHGYVNIQKHIFSLEYNGGTKETEVYRKDIEITFRIIRPFLEKWGAMTPDYDTVYQQALGDMQQTNFRTVGNMVVVWGQKEGVFQPKMTVAPTMIVAPPPTQKALTDRETQIAVLVAKGFRNNDIKDKLGISIGTVHAHLASIYAKLNFVTRAQIVKYVLENHLGDISET